MTLVLNVGRTSSLFYQSSMRHTNNSPLFKMQCLGSRLIHHLRRGTEGTKSLRRNLMYAYSLKNHIASYTSIQIRSKTISLCNPLPILSFPYLRILFMRINMSYIYFLQQSDSNSTDDVCFHAQAEFCDLIQWLWNH